MHALCRIQICVHVHFLLHDHSGGSFAFACTDQPPFSLFRYLREFTLCSSRCSHHLYLRYGHIFFYQELRPQVNCCQRLRLVKYPLRVHLFINAAVLYTVDLPLGSESFLGIPCSADYQ